MEPFIDSFIGNYLKLHCMKWVTSLKLVIDSWFLGCWRHSVEAFKSAIVLIFVFIAVEINKAGLNKWLCL